MMMKPRYELVYDVVFRFLAENHIQSYPVDLDAVCRCLGIETVPLLTIARTSTLSCDDVRAICGNNDGAVFTLLKGGAAVAHKIIYNNLHPETRQRFTIAEECAHVLLGHVLDTQFDILRSSNDARYRAYEAEARTAAGLLLCSPRVMLLCANVLTPDVLATVCGISRECASVRIEQHGTFHEQMCLCPSYEALPMPEIVSPAARRAIHKRLMDDALEQRRLRKAHHHARQIFPQL